MATAIAQPFEHTPQVLDLEIREVIGEFQSNFSDLPD